MRTILIIALLAFASCDIILRGYQKRCIRTVIGKRPYKELMDAFEGLEERVPFLEFVNQKFPQYEVDIGRCLLAEKDAKGRKLEKTRFEDAGERLGGYINEKTRDIFANKAVKKEITVAYKKEGIDAARAVCLTYVKNEIACRAATEIIAKRFPKY